MMKDLTSHMSVVVDDSPSRFVQSSSCQIIHRSSIIAPSFGTPLVNSTSTSNLCVRFLYLRVICMVSLIFYHAIWPRLFIVARFCFQSDVFRCVSAAPSATTFVSSHLDIHLCRPPMSSAASPFVSSLIGNHYWFLSTACFP